MDKYAHLAPGGNDRSCRRADGGPKRRLTQGRAEADAAVLIDDGEDVHAYECPACGAWHVGHRPQAA